MAMFVGILGMLGVPCCLVWLIVNAVRRNSKKPPVVGVLACIVLFFAGAAMSAPDSKEPPSETVETPGDSPESALRRDTPEAGTGNEMDVLPVKTETENPEAAGQTEGALQTGDYQLPCGAKLHFYDSVHNDVTGKWRRSGTSSSLPPANFAIEYYENMFSSDDEIHSVWNASLKTTTKISVSGNLLFVDTFEYVDGEEQDAKKMFSGIPLDSQIVNLETGELMEISEPELKSAAPPSGSEAGTKTTPSPASDTPMQPAGSGAPEAFQGTDGASSGSRSGGGNSSNFYTYDNSDQQKTEDDWVLNTNTMKIHYPSCREVRKISPKNYSTSNLSQSELTDKGYTTCGVCHK